MGWIRRFFWLQRLRARRGFSLLELSISVLIIGIMIASILPAITQQQYKEKSAKLDDNLATITKALKSYAIQHGRLPCPAAPGTTRESGTFTNEAANPGTCTGGSPAASASGANTVSGAFPAASIGLPPDKAFDPWGRAYTYLVDVRMTAEHAIRTYPLNDTTVGSITKQRRNPVTNTTFTEVDDAVVAIVAHGPNGHGAFLPSGQRYSGAITNADELENCDCNSSGVTGTANATLVEAARSGTAGNPAAGYDDKIQLLRRDDFITMADRDPQPYNVYVPGE